jgi:hypothetical protein
VKVIIAGCRDTPPPISMMCVIAATEKSGFQITEVTCGCSPGIDQAGCAWARENKLPVDFHPGWRGQQENFANRNWQVGDTQNPIPRCKSPTAAGPIRNRAMAIASDALIAVWDGKSKGTKDMIEEATKRGLKVYVFRTDEERP